jgi:adenine-specific DNA-methyltransferase
MGSAVFDYPKDETVLQKFIQMAGGDGKDSIVLDFFAGSGTTGHAVLAQNAEDGLCRRCVLVQLPEPLDINVKEQRAAAEFCDSIGRPRNIAELTKERLRRAGKRVAEEHPQSDIDIGYRVFKLASSNIRAWENSTSDLAGTLLANAEHLVQGRTEQDVLYELLLKLGLDLCVPIKTKVIGGKAVHSVGGGALIVCLADGVDKELVESLAQGIVSWRKELAPAVDTRVVFKDSGFVDDVAKSNMAAILNQNGISDVRSV